MKIKQIILTSSSFLEFIIISTETHCSLGDPKVHILVVSLMELLFHAVLQTHVRCHLLMFPPAVAEHRVNWKYRKIFGWNCLKNIPTYEKNL